jgi:glycyl-tRNA synthetase beta chain
MSEFLFEIFSEEVPARMQQGASEALEKTFRDKLEKAGLAFDGITSFSTPRRFGLCVTGLPAQQPDKSEEFRGPRVDGPPQAIDGFLKSRNITLEQCTKQETDKGTYWIYTEKTSGKPTAQALADVCVDVIANFAWPKSMRWGSHALRWVRPLLSVLAIFDGKTVEFDVPQMSGMKSGNVTAGHRFLAPAAITVKDFADYKAQMDKGFVVIDRAARRAKIVQIAEVAAKKENLSLRADEALLDELTGLVEFPYAVVGTFDAGFLEVPAEALVASMRGHQKYLSLLSADGRLSNRFVVITNVPPEGARAENIVTGNQKVLRARLSDAKFFWDQDCKIKLADRAPKLEAITFHAKLGTVAQKVARLEALSAIIAKATGADAAQAETAARLCKADLVSSMVGEFPELQGTMGMYYAQRQGEKPDVAAAIADHYKPVGANDSVPTKPVSIAVALADKIDTVTGFFAIDEKPTGSKDPYALRRATLGIIRIILKNNLRLPLETLFSESAQLYVQQKNPHVKSADIASFGIMDFVSDRMKQALKDEGMKQDLIEAVFANLRGGETADLSRLLKRIQSLQEFLSKDDGINLLAGYKRASNIVRIEQEKAKKPVTGDVQPTLLKEQEETALFDALQKVQGAIPPMLDADDYTGAMKQMSLLRQPIDSFFEKVIVNDNDAAVRENRLRLLGHVQKTVNQVADFSRIK